MSQAVVIGGAILAAFILYLAANSRLSAYLAVVGL
jgi:hypothetical protein